MTTICNPEGHVSTHDAAKLLGRAEETLRGWRHRQVNLVELPFHRGENGRITYSLDDIQNFIREQTGEQMDEEEGAAAFSDVHDLAAELVKIRRRKRLKAASRMLTRAVEILTDDTIEMDTPALLAQEADSVEYGELFSFHLKDVRERICDFAHWLWVWSEPRVPEPEADLNDNAA